MSPDNGSNASALTLRDYITTVGQEKFLVAGITVGAILLGLVFATLQGTTYSATARVLTTPIPFDAPGILPPLSPDTEAEVASSQTVTDLVAEELGEVPPGSIDVQPVIATQVLVFTFSGSDPDETRDATNAYANAYIEDRGARIQGMLDDALEAVELRIDEHQELLDDVDAEVAAARREGDNALIEDLEVRRSALVVRMGLLQDRAAQIQPESTGELARGELIDPAETPSQPVSPNYERTAVLALVAGLMLGLAAAFMKDYWRRSAPAAR